MFDLDASKIVIVGVAALIFIPPKDLPRVLRQVGQFVGKMKRMANEFQGQFMDAMREADMADLRKEAQKLSDATRIDVGLNSVHDFGKEMRPLPMQDKADTEALGTTTPGSPGHKPATETEPAAPPAPSPTKVEPAPEPQHTS